MRSGVTSESHVVCSIQSLTPCNPYISLRHCTIKSRGLLYLSQNYKKKFSWHFILANSFFKILLLFFFSERDHYMTLYIYIQENKTKLNEGWHSGKGLIYYRPIFRLTKLAFPRARAMPMAREYLLTVPKI